ncbi:MAG TPA: hypothetical protein VHF50_01560 [Solirubrobacterales bacterium]|nr:hypothetical protein [Solirubrobacterales bacterium]
MLARFTAAACLACGLLASAGVAAEPADARLFKGKTAQGFRIKLVVKERAFRIHAFDAELRCSDGNRLLLEEGGFLWTRVSKAGRFRDAQFGRTDSVYFRGQVTERRIRGRVRLTDRLKKGVRCRSGWIRFNATPR